MDVQVVVDKSQKSEKYPAYAYPAPNYAYPAPPYAYPGPADGTFCRVCPAGLSSGGASSSLAPRLALLRRLQSLLPLRKGVSRWLAARSRAAAPLIAADAVRLLMMHHAKPWLTVKDLTISQSRASAARGVEYQAPASLMAIHRLCGLPKQCNLSTAERNDARLLESGLSESKV